MCAIFCFLLAWRADHDVADADDEDDVDVDESMDMEDMEEDMETQNEDDITMVSSITIDTLRCHITF